MQTTETRSAEAPISITPPAAAFIKRMVRMSGLPKATFRLSVSPGGCSGLSATFSVESEPAPGDVVLSAGELRMFVPASCRALLDGVTIDFADSPTKTGFVFVDPKAGACDCSSGNTKIQIGNFS
jgi:iron-sulfur cluster assembly protein